MLTEDIIQSRLVLEHDGKIQSAFSVVAAAFATALTPDPVMSVDEWADSKRILSSVSSSEPGEWRTDRTPYLREIMWELSPQSRTRRVVLMKGAQTGGSESGFNWLGHIVDVAPGPAMMVQPTTDTAKKVSKQRIDPMIEACPSLREKIQDPRARDSGNTILVKEFRGGVLILTGANSAVGLRSMPVRYLFLDEVDGYPTDVDEEGDPVALAIQRTANFPNKKIFECSTPTVKGASRIEKSFLEGDQRYFMMPCPHCSAYQKLSWGQVKWRSGQHREAWYECEHCHEAIPHFKKAWMLSKGLWEATAECDGETRSYHLSALYSPWVTWGEIADEFIKAGKDPVRLKPWMNTKLGETFEDNAGETIDPNSLMGRREDYGGRIPAEVCILTCGIDVQDDRLELELVGWGVGEESWSLDYHVIRGDPSGKDVWRLLDQYLLQRFDHELKEEGLRIAAAAIDTGGHHTLAAYNFVRPRQKRRVWGIKGLGSKGRVKPPLWPRRPSKNNKGKIDLYTIGVDSGKEAVYARLRKLEKGPGYCHFGKKSVFDGSECWDQEYFDGLTAEKCKTKYLGGFPVQVWWKPDGKRNEPLDCRVYAYAALQGLISMGVRLTAVAAKMFAEVETPPPEAEHVPEEPRHFVAPEVIPQEEQRRIERKRAKRRTIRSGYM